MKKNTLLSIMLSSCMIISLAACASGNSTGPQNSGSEASSDIPQASAAETTVNAGTDTSSPEEYQPVTITNMDNELVFEKAPEKIVVLSYDTAEILAALGLEDKVIGLAEADSSIDDVLPKYRDSVSKMPVIGGLSNGVPSLEAVLAMGPDFVYGASYSFMEQNAGKAQDYLDSGINVYGSTGTYSDIPTLEDTYLDIENLGKIFGVEDKASELINDLKNRVDAINSTEKSDKPLTVFVYDSEEDAPYTAGGSSLENKIIELAGGENIYKDLDSDFKSVAWEDVISKNPDVILINKYGGENDVQQKINFLKSMPELAEVTAVKEDHFVSASMLAVFPSIQNVEVIEELSEKFNEWK
ncbi:ABC transporter substrate-binding protein [Butyrivibrio sp. XB500-5]|uniref:ABC transporter substrate-binding protein n=1 Tax=Butyrivibrio sp. XB500-5 TaxID=2364880 RepID=UPI001314D93A|nr:ABC transporter substrate-binding protein [Butyrivibrio sp. XB500-5]